MRPRHVSANSENPCFRNPSLGNTGLHVWCRWRSSALSGGRVDMWHMGKFRRIAFPAWPCLVFFVLPTCLKGRKSTPTTSLSLVSKQAVTRGLFTKWVIPTLLLTRRRGGGSFVVVVLWLPNHIVPQFWHSRSLKDSFQDVVVSRISLPNLICSRYFMWF